mmetsp:Transcript_33360/g.86531  ORF Transcript_33360/g.86531 Transcript_33360/m.86531 type:complete len:120 (-) Transcript_33360:174-533(-)
MKTRQVPIIPVSHIPRAIRLVATPTTGQKSRQGSGHKSLDDGEVGQHHPPPRPGRTLTVSAMLGTPETAKATRQSLASHDGEVRQMQAKATMFKGKAHTQKPNASTRKLHHIGQPRRHN